MDAVSRPLVDVNLQTILSTIKYILKEKREELIEGIKNDERFGFDFFAKEFQILRIDYLGFLTQFPNKVELMEGLLDVVYSSEDIRARIANNLELKVFAAHANQFKDLENKVDEWLVMRLLETVNDYLQNRNGTTVPTSHEKVCAILGCIHSTCCKESRSKYVFDGSDDKRNLPLTIIINYKQDMELLCRICRIINHFDFSPKSSPECLKFTDHVVEAAAMVPLYEEKFSVRMAQIDSVRCTVHRLWEKMNNNDLLKSLASIYAIICREETVSACFASILGLIPIRILEILAPKLERMEEINSPHQFENTLNRLCTWIMSWYPTLDNTSLWIKTITNVMVQMKMWKEISNVITSIMPKYLQTIQLPNFRDIILEVVKDLYVGVIKSDTQNNLHFNLELLRSLCSTITEGLHKTLTDPKQQADWKKAEMKMGNILYLLKQNLPNDSKSQSRLIMTEIIDMHPWQLLPEEEETFLFHADSNRTPEATITPILPIPVQEMVVNPFYGFIIPQDTEVTSIIVPRNARIGINNIGNTCYFNSVVQALFATEEFRYFVTHHDLVNSERHTFLQDLMGALTFSTMESITPTTEMVLTSIPGSRLTEQHDVAELFENITVHYDSLEKAILQKTDNPDLINDLREYWRRILREVHYPGVVSVPPCVRGDVSPPKEDLEKVLANCSMEDKNKRGLDMELEDDIDVEMEDVSCTDAMMQPVTDGQKNVDGSNDFSGASGKSPSGSVKRKTEEDFDANLKTKSSKGDGIKTSTPEKVNVIEEEIDSDPQSSYFDGNSDSGVSVQAESINDNMSSAGATTEEEDEGIFDSKHESRPEIANYTDDVDFVSTLINSTNNCSKDDYSTNNFSEEGTVDENLRNSGKGKSSKENSCNKTFIEHLFGGKSVHLIQCPTCKHLFDKEDYFLDLKLALDCCSVEDSRHSVSSIINYEYYQRTEDLEKYVCGKCGIKGNAKTYFRLIQAPHVLVVTLCRYTIAADKNMANIAIEEVMDIPIVSYRGKVEAASSVLRHESSSGSDPSLSTLKISDTFSSPVKNLTQNITGSSFTDSSEKQDVNFETPPSSPFVNKQADATLMFTMNREKSSDESCPPNQEPNRCVSDLPNQEANGVDLSSSSNQESLTLTFKQIEEVELSESTKFSDISVDSALNVETSITDSSANLAKPEEDTSDTSRTEQGDTTMDMHNSNDSSSDTAHFYVYGEHLKLGEQDTEEYCNPNIALEGSTTTTVADTTSGVSSKASEAMETSQSTTTEVTDASQNNTTNTIEFQEGTAKYVLYAIVSHHGESNKSGHYFTYCRSSTQAVQNYYDPQQPAQWFHLDDWSSVRITFQEIVSTLQKYQTQTPYMLFYRRIPLEKSLPDLTEHVSAETLVSLGDRLKDVVTKHCCKDFTTEGEALAAQAAANGTLYIPPRPSPDKENNNSHCGVPIHQPPADFGY